VSRFSTRLTATVVACGALLAVTALPATAADRDRHNSQRSSVVLGAVQYDSPGPDNRSARSLNEEWVTVTNIGRSAVNLGGWTLSDTDRNVYRFDYLRLGGHQSVRVHTGFGHDTSRDVYQDRRSYVWDNADTATLRDSRGRVVDSESWGRHHEGGGREGGGGHDRGGRR
jgi:hypothetical protein